MSKLELAAAVPREAIVDLLRAPKQKQEIDETTIVKTIDSLLILPLECMRRVSRERVLDYLLLIDKYAESLQLCIKGRALMLNILSLPNMNAVVVSVVFLPG